MVSAIEHRFQTVYHRAPDTVARAPGRINLIGEHVDYQDGLVLPAAIEPSILGAAARNEEPVVRVWTELSEGVPAEASLDQLERLEGKESWLNYLIGVLAVLRQKGAEMPGFDLVLTADLPTGAGLSSSAALETVTALIVESLNGAPMDPVQRALICQQAEHEYAGVPCGIMDQLAVSACSADHALMVDCRDLSLKPVRIPEGVAMVVADTRVKHALGDGEYRKRRDDCETAARILNVDSLRDASLDQVHAAEQNLGDRLFRRARHAATEIQRVIDFAHAMESTDFTAVSQLMRASHDSLRDDYEVSCPELDFLVDAATAFGPRRGWIGSRMTGGGFGGSTINLVRAEHAETFSEYLRNAFRDQFSQPPQVFTTRAAEGARILIP